MHKEQNYDFRQRHWEYHRPVMRQTGRDCMCALEYELWQIQRNKKDKGNA